MITARWKKEHPGDKLSASTLYRGIRNKIIGDVTATKHLRRRGKRKYSRRSKYNTIHPEHVIHERPEAANRRARIGDWEGDTIVGAYNKSRLVTLVDRRSRLLTLRIIKGRNAEDTCKAMKEALEGLPVQSITLDNGSEFALFATLEEQLHTTVYFADPHSPWQRGSNENINGLIRFFFPKGTDFRKVSPEEVQRVEDLINRRPRKCLSWLSPLVFFLLHST